MKKTLALILALILSLGFVFGLAACDTDATNVPEPGTDDPESDGAGGKVEIVKEVTTH